MTKQVYIAKEDRDLSSETIVAVKDSAKGNLEFHKVDPEKQIDKLTKKAGKVLLKIKSVFPFDLFPDTLIVDENKVDIIYYKFFFEKNYFSALIKNINSVHVNTGILFASMTFELTGYESNPEPIKYLWVKDAIKARRIILGLISAAKENVDVSRITSNDLAKKMEEIGNIKDEVKPAVKI